MNYPSAMMQLQRAELPKGRALIKLAKGQFPVKAVNQIAAAVKAGDTNQALKLAKFFDKKVGGKTRGTIICGQQNTRDHRRPVVIEQRSLAPTTVAAGADVVAAIQAVVGFIDTAQNRNFLNSSQNVAGAQELLRSQVHGRLLVGLGYSAEFIVQPNPGGVAEMPNEWASRYLTNLFYRYGFRVFPASSGEPHLDTTTVEYFRSGATLLDNLRVPYSSDNARVELIPPGSAPANDSDGSKALPALIFGNDVQVTGHIQVTGLFISSN